MFKYDNNRRRKKAIVSYMLVIFLAFSKIVADEFFLYIFLFVFRENKTYSTYSSVFFFISFFLVFRKKKDLA